MTNNCTLYSGFMGNVLLNGNDSSVILELITQLHYMEPVEYNPNEI